MELVPEDVIKPSTHFNFAPMIDFLFLMLALFATLAVSRAALYDSEVELTQLKPEKGAASLRTKEVHQIHLSIASDGSFKWLTEFQQYPMETVLDIQEELAREYKTGALPENKAKTEVLLHIDKKAPWGQVAEAIFGVREVGFSARPVYDGTE